jgi:hypothetical protein
MKTFYTERDIEEMHAAGVTQIEMKDSVVLTDLAREKAASLGIALVQPGVSSTVASTPPTLANLNEAQLVAHIKARVIARLGSDDYNGLLDQIIPNVLAQLNAQSAPTTSGQSPRNY